MSNIGDMMNASAILRDELHNPVQQLRSVIAQMQADIQWFRAKFPDANIEKKQQLIIKLDAICRSLEACEPVDVWRIIWDKLGEAKRDGYDGDVALCYFPLKPILPAYHQAKQVVVDLCGYNLEPYEYDYCRGKFFASWINEEEGTA